MGELLPFPVDRVRRPPLAVAAPPAFCFDLTDPFSYLAAERVERMVGEADWVAVDATALAPRPRGRALRHLRERAEARAAELRLPLVWPDRGPVPAPQARRVAAYACELGAGPAFALAACRLVFCGGFRLDDPEILAEAAAAAALPLGGCLEAARETWRDAELREAAVGLRAAGVLELPAFRVGGRWYGGEPGLALAAGHVADAPAIRRPLAPVG
jgi:2-hydroxychromene-2-carboxylate isomerase